MAERSERDTEIAREGADISPLADQRLAIGVVAIGHGNEPQRGDLHRPRGQSGGPVRSRERIGPVAVDLDRRIRRRRLQDRTGKAGQDRLDRLATRPQRAFANDFALAIVGGATYTPADAEAIAFAAGHRVCGGFGRLAQRYRQHAGCQRVESARMSYLGSGEATDHIDDPARAEPQRLVDDQPAVRTTITRHHRGSRFERPQGRGHVRLPVARAWRRSAVPDQTRYPAQISSWARNAGILRGRRAASRM